MPPAVPFAYTLAIVAAVVSTPLAAIILAVMGLILHWLSVRPPRQP